MVVSDHAPNLEVVGDAAPPSRWPAAPRPSPACWATSSPTRPPRRPRRARRRPRRRAVLMGRLRRRLPALASAVTGIRSTPATTRPRWPHEHHAPRGPSPTTMSCVGASGAAPCGAPLARATRWPPSPNTRRPPPAAPPRRRRRAAPGPARHAPGRGPAGPGASGSCAPPWCVWAAHQPAGRARTSRTRVNLDVMTCCTATSAAGGGRPAALDADLQRALARLHAPRPPPRCGSPPPTPWPGSRRRPGGRRRRPDLFATHDPAALASLAHGLARIVRPGGRLLAAPGGARAPPWRSRRCCVPPASPRRSRRPTRRPSCSPGGERRRRDAGRSSGAGRLGRTRRRFGGTPATCANGCTGWGALALRCSRPREVRGAGVLGARRMARMVGPRDLVVVVHYTFDAPVFAAAAAGPGRAVLPLPQHHAAPAAAPPRARHAARCADGPRPPARTGPPRMSRLGRLGVQLHRARAHGLRPPRPVGILTGRAPRPPPPPRARTGCRRPPRACCSSAGACRTRATTTSSPPSARCARPASTPPSPSWRLGRRPRLPRRMRGAGRPACQSPATSPHRPRRRRGPRRPLPRRRRSVRVPVRARGFCVPLLEAMWAGLPIVAFAAGAVPETAGAAALPVGDRTPSLVPRPSSPCATSPPCAPAWRTPRTEDPPPCGRRRRPAASGRSAPPGSAGRGVTAPRAYGLVLFPRARSGRPDAPHHPDAASSPRARPSRRRPRWCAPRPGVLRHATPARSPSR